MDTNNISVSEMEQFVARFATLHGSEEAFVDSRLPGHRRFKVNLVGMGVVPFEFKGSDSRKTLKLTGEETVSIQGLETVQPLQDVACTITYPNGDVAEITLKCRIDTAIEIEYVEHGGVLPYVLRNLAQ